MSLLSTTTCCYFLRFGPHKLPINPFKGNQIWYGNHKLALKHFKAVGLPLGKHVNPADVYLEAVNVSFMEADEKGPHLQNLMDAWDKSDQKQVCSTPM